MTLDLLTIFLVSTAIDLPATTVPDRAAWEI